MLLDPQGKPVTSAPVAPGRIVVQRDPKAGAMLFFLANSTTMKGAFLLMSVSIELWDQFPPFREAMADIMGRFLAHVSGTSLEGARVLITKAGDPVRSTTTPEIVIP